LFIGSLPIFHEKLVKIFSEDFSAKLLTDRRQTDKRRRKHDLFGGGNKQLVNEQNNGQCMLLKSSFVIKFRLSVKAKFHYAIWSEAGRRPAASWNLAYHLAR